MFGVLHLWEFDIITISFLLMCFPFLQIQLASAILGTLTLAPSETLRIRSVAQPDYAPNVLGVAQRMVEASFTFEFYFDVMYLSDIIHN